MTTVLEDRLAAAADSLDRLIGEQITVVAHRRDAEVRTPVRALALVAGTAALLIGGLVWLSGDRIAPVASPGPTASAPAPAASSAPPAEQLASTPTVSTSIVPWPLPIAEPSPDAPPLAIGESVMLGAAPQLAAGGFVVDADVSRQGAQLVGAAERIAAAGGVGETVVVQMGTNGPVDGATYDTLATLLAEVDRVVFLTVYAPEFSWIEANNDLIWALPARFENIVVLDWANLVASGQVPGLAGDGIHLGTDAAKQFYANYVFDLIGRRDLVQPLAG